MNETTKLAPCTSFYAEKRSASKGNRSSLHMDKENIALIRASNDLHCIKTSAKVSL